MSYGYCCHILTEYDRHVPWSQCKAAQTQVPLAFCLKSRTIQLMLPAGIISELLFTSMGRHSTFGGGQTKKLRCLLPTYHLARSSFQLLTTRKTSVGLAIPPSKTSFSSHQNLQNHQATHSHGPGCTFASGLQVCQLRFRLYWRDSNLRDKLPKDYQDYGKWNDMLERVFRQSTAALKVNHLNVNEFSHLFIQLYFLEMVWTHLCKFVYGWKSLIGFNGTFPSRCRRWPVALAQDGRRPRSSYEEWIER